MEPLPAATPTARPPQWAETLLGMLVRPERRSSVTGDLLEEYRECQVPALGLRRANRWYVAQVFRSAWGLAKVFCVAAVLLHTWREAVDELIPVASYMTRSLILTYGMLTISASAGFWSGWRTGRVRTGALIAAIASFAGWSGAGIVAISLALINVPGRLHPGGADELVLLPFFTLPVVVTLGAFGAGIGVALQRIRPTTTPS
jgi:hypothetical protein